MTGEGNSAFIVAIIQQASNRAPLLATFPPRYSERKGASDERLHLRHLAREFLSMSRGPIYVGMTIGDG